MLEAYPDGAFQEDSRGHLPLHLALWWFAEPEVIIILVKACPKALQRRDRDGDLPLHYALQSPQPPEVVMALLAGYPEGASVQGREGRLPLHFALGSPFSEVQPAEVILALLHAYPEGSSAETSRSFSGVLPLHHAVICGLPPEVVAALTCAYPDGASVRSPPNSGDLPLHIALCRSQVPDVIMALLRAHPEGASAAGRHGELPLHLALINGTLPEAVTTLINAYPDASSTAVTTEVLPLHVAFDNAMPVEVVMALLSAYPNGASANTLDGRLPLHVALMKRWPLKVVTALLEVYPQAASAKCPSSNLPVHYAIKNGALLEVVAALLNENSCGALTANSRGFTPLHTAANVPRTDVVQLLLDHGANPLAQDREGRTALAHFADSLLDREERERTVAGMLHASAGALSKDGPFTAKAAWFINCIQQLQEAEFRRQPQRRPVVTTVLRGQVLEGLCAALQGKEGAALLQRLEITIHGEGAAGDGVVREVLLLLAREVCDGDVGLFQEDSEGGGLHPSSRSGVQLDHLEYFNLIGKLIGVALGSGFHLPVHLSIPLLKILLGQNLAVDDLKDIDGVLYRNLVQRLRSLCQGELRDLCLDFTYDDEFFGSVQTVELLPCGLASRRVETHADLDIYLGLVAQHLMVGRVDRQIGSLQQGVHALIPEALLRAAGKVLSPEDLRELIEGAAEIDDAAADDWRMHTDYKGGYHAEDGTVQHFWMIVQECFSPRERGALLRFVHGSSKAPARGFAFLRGYDGEPHRFTLHKEPAPPPERQELREAYPRPQTCFNTLYLPSYIELQEVERRMRAVIQESAAGFDEGAVAA